MTFLCERRANDIDRHWQNPTTFRQVLAELLDFKKFLSWMSRLWRVQSVLSGLILLPSECPYCRWWDCVLLGFAKKGEAVVAYSWDMWGQTKAQQSWENDMKQPTTTIDIYIYTWYILVKECQRFKKSMKIPSIWSTAYNLPPPPVPASAVATSQPHGNHA